MIGFVTGKGGKYGNHKVVVLGRKFDSKREAERYAFLLDAQGKGLISELECQRVFELIPKVSHIEVEQLKTKTREREHVDQMAITYKADFVYRKNGQMVVEDVKISEKLLPKEYVLKEKLFFLEVRHQDKEGVLSRRGDIAQLPNQ